MGIRHRLTDSERDDLTKDVDDLDAVYMEKLRKDGIDEDLFENDYEKELYTKYNQVKFRTFETYDEELEALFALKPELDNFFDNVFVNHENEKIKINRKNLVGVIYQGFRKIADIKEITI